MNIQETSSKKLCPDCGAVGEHYCVGKSYKPEACNINFPAFDNPPHPVPMPGYTYGKSEKLRMSQKEITEFGKWLKENEPALREECTDDYWELFAYRIVAKLGV